MTPAGTLTLDSHTLRLLRLAAGTRLFHGTNCAGNFERIEAPAWFCLDETSARWWISWRTPPEGRSAGADAVVEYETTSDLYLIDTGKAEDMHRLAQVVTGNLYVWGTRRTLAGDMRDAGLPGWIGNNEVCLVSTSGIRLVEKRAVARAAG